MASRVSAVREVLGLPAEDSLLLAQHDEEFFEEAEVAESSSSSSDDDLFSDRSARGASDDSEQEENLDSVDLADRSTGSLADLLDDEPAPKRPRTEPTTLEEVSEKVRQGCKCSGKNCFVAVLTSALLEFATHDGSHQLRNKRDFLTWTAPYSGSPRERFSRWPGTGRGTRRAAFVSPTLTPCTVKSLPGRVSVCE